MTGFNIGFMLRLLSQHPGEVCYPLAANVELLDSVTKAEFKRSVPGYKDCCAAFASAVGVVSGPDLIEEFLATKIWPLSCGWLPDSFAKIEVSGLKERLPYPNFRLQKPSGVSDEFIVEEAE